MTSIDTLPDDVLLEIFNLHGYYDVDSFGDKREKAWQTLVHVCRRWRCIVFGSPRHLNLQLVCTERTPARDMLNIWPALPLIVTYRDYGIGSVDNIIAALECSDRVYQISFNDIWSSELDTTTLLDILLGAMQQTFPELTNLALTSFSDKINETMGVVPDSFLGGSAPRLEFLWLFGIPFPGLPKLLLSATHLVSLRIDKIPHSGYFSPDAMVAVLSTSTSLEDLSLVFESPRSCPDQESRRLPPSTRSVLPSLTFFQFTGVSEYLDDLVACIDAPQLNHLTIAFFNDIEFDTPQLVPFISHTPKSKALESVDITLQDWGASIEFSSQTSYRGLFEVKIRCRGLDWLVAAVEQVCTSCLPPLYMLEDLYLHEQSRSPPDRKNSVENREWLDLFRPFMAVKNLYLSENLAFLIAPALQELVEGRTSDVLPALQNIFLKGLESSGSVQETIGKLVAARQAANHPIVISPWIDLESEHWGDR